MANSKITVSNNNQPMIVMANLASPQRYQLWQKVDKKDRRRLQLTINRTLNLMIQE